MNNDLHHLAGAYALDALDLNERAAFEAHYETCDICVEEVRSYQEAAATLADGVAVEPPPELKAQVMAQIQQTPQRGPIVVDLADARSTRRPRFAAIVAAAAAFVLIAGGIVASQVGSNGPTSDDLIAAPDAIVTSLEGEVGSLQVVWSAERDQVAIIGTNLADTDAGQTYELWFVQDEGVAKAALFEPDDGMVNIVLDVDDVSTNGFGVTIEPDGGSDQPTGDILYVGLI